MRGGPAATGQHEPQDWVLRRRRAHPRRRARGFRGLLPRRRPRQHFVSRPARVRFRDLTQPGRPLRARQHPASDHQGSGGPQPVSTCRSRCPACLAIVRAAPLRGQCRTSGSRPHQGRDPVPWPTVRSQNSSQPAPAPAPSPDCHRPGAGLPAVPAPLGVPVNDRRTEDAAGTKGLVARPDAGDGDGRIVSGMARTWSMRGPAWRPGGTRCASRTGPQDRTGRGFGRPPPADLRIEAPGPTRENASPRQFVAWWTVSPSSRATAYLGRAARDGPLR